MSPRVLVVGGFGYVGGRLCGRLLERGWAVRASSRRARETPRRRGLERLLLDPGTSSPQALSGAVREVDAIVHLAAPAETAAETKLSVRRLLAAAASARVERFVYFSSVHVYGQPLSGTITEAKARNPLSPYAAGHALAEDQVLAAGRRGELEAVVIRLSNAVGAPADAGIERWSLAANDFCRQALAGGRIVLRSPGLERRNLVPMTDIVGAVEHLLRLPSDELGQGVFNLGGEDSPKILDLAHLVRERARLVFGFEPAVVAPPGEPGAAPAADLDFRSDRLLATGFERQGTLAGEIDGTLEACVRFFGAPA